MPSRSLSSSLRWVWLTPWYRVPARCTTSAITADRRQLVLPVATTILAGRDGQSSRPPTSSCAGHRLCRYTVRVNSIDTPSDSRNCHYVNRFVREIRPPARWRFSSPRFRSPRLRKHRIIRPRVVAPAIQSAPAATHSIASMLYEVSRPSGTFLIPDYTPAEHLNPRSSGSGQRSRAQCLTHVATPVQQAALHQDPTDRIAIIKRSNLHGTYR